MKKLNKARVLIYSHDSFGLGHLRRCRAIAHALVDTYKGLSVLILSGSPIISRFDFKARVDFVRIPGIIKLHNGNYTSLGLHIDLEDTLALRESIIQHTAQVFAPDIFLVDKEPTGLQGEVLSTLEMLKTTQTKNILGLRDVMDAPELLSSEWERKNVRPVLDEFYDEIWVYGPEVMGNPLEDVEGMANMELPLYFTGYIERHLPDKSKMKPELLPEQPFILVTTGGGGDGIQLVDSVLTAYEQKVQPRPALFVLGPFMKLSKRKEFLQRAENLDQVSMQTFSPNLEYLMSLASAVITMGGYNTFCEILSFDKPTLMIPRVKPRKEQWIRANKAQDHGLVYMLEPEDSSDTNTMHQAIEKLCEQPKPSTATVNHLLTGLQRINERVADIIDNNKEKSPTRVFFYVQYLLGIGHVRRAALLVDGMVEAGFEVHVIFGGIPLPGMPFDKAIVHYLPAVKSIDANFSDLANADGSPLTEMHQQERSQQLLTLAQQIKPEVIITETYPFGRRKMRFELNPLLEWAHSKKPRPLIVSSIRDILQRRKEKREQETINLVQQYYDRVMVHGDKNFTALQNSFPPAQLIKDKIDYTGYVCPSAPRINCHREGIIVSVGGGSVGHDVLSTALDLFLDGYEADSHWYFFTGPNIDEKTFEKLQCHANERMTVMKMAMDFVQRLATARLSISLGGYNTTMDILQTSVPAVVIPFEGEEETEQLERAQMLSESGRIELLRHHDLSTSSLKQAMASALQQSPDAIPIAIDGAARSGKMLWDWWEMHD